jgi:hypothetical protein
MYFLLNYTAGLGIQHGIPHLGSGALWIEAKNSLTRGSASGSVKNGLLFNPPQQPSCPHPYLTALGQIEPRQKDDI